MNLRKLIIGAAIAALGCGAAMAQNTLGDLLDAKAQTLSKDEVQATIVGATVSGPIPGNMNIEAVTHLMDRCFAILGLSNGLSDKLQSLPLLRAVVRPSPV